MQWLLQHRGPRDFEGETTAGFCIAASKFRLLYVREVRSELTAPPFSAQDAPLLEHLRIEIVEQTA